ncbi:OsmC family protein [Fodinicurvata sediminis]|uniref:OsmC family protein n=1 Tax=Fodinicurvata sediminis TaxID=1121832 RepID=UPI0003B3DDDD|nr:OsmC family protein [Fodinicurvata sediminis]
MKSRNASAIWNGDLKGGNGRISSDSGVLDKSAYSFATRFEDGKGTNPEELIAAAHAGCYSMALSNELAGDGMSPESVETRASVTLDQVEGGFAITKIHLDVKAKVPGASQADFDAAAERAKTGCPVSKLMNAEITLASQLDS